MNSPRGFTRRQFVSAAVAAAGASLLPDPFRATPGQDPVVDAAGTPGHPDIREHVQWRVKPFPVSQVRLAKGDFKAAMEADQRYLTLLPSDRLLHNFRVNAGLPSSAEPLGGWERPNCELRGHFTGGHYLSACALMYASTGDEDLKKKADAMVGELA